MPELTYENTLRELPTDEGVLRYHEAGDGAPLLMLHGSGPGVTGWRNYEGNLALFAELPMRTIPRAELPVFPDAGHWVMIEQKRAWESAVLAFLTRPDSA